MSGRVAVGIAGAGRVARAIARLLVEGGAPVVGIASRTERRARAAAEFAGAGVAATTYEELPRMASRFLIAVPDGAIEGVAAALAGAACGGVALHTCGARGAEALQALAERGVACGALHPLQTIAGEDEGAEALRGVWFAVSGDAAALGWAEEIADLVGGGTFVVDAAARPLYHAAAVMASNCVTGLMDAAAELMSAAGVERSAALRALGPLARRTVENALALGPERALTGPVERGDAATVAAHLAALGGVRETVADLYRAGELQALDIARRRGLAPDRGEEIERLLRSK